MIENVKPLKNEDKIHVKTKNKKGEDDILLFCLDNSMSMDMRDKGDKTRKQLMVIAIEK